MKKNKWLYLFFFLPEILCILWLVISLSSCTVLEPKTKKDCQGTKHTKQKGGFYL